MDTITDLHRLDNENEEKFIWRIGQAKDSGEVTLSWDEIADIINKEFRSDESEYRTEAAYRKPYSQAKRYFESGAFRQYNDDDSYFKELRVLKQELEKERIKTRDERNELRRVLREEARKESYKEQLLRSISEYQCDPLGYDVSKQFTGILKSDNDLICTFFDVHTGLHVDNIFNTFNENILKDRINQYLDKIFEVQLRHYSENINVILSELISGTIHLALRIENNQNLIEQFLTVMNYLSQFLSELSYHFNCVNVYVCPGNHSRLQPKKEDNMRGENMDLLALPFLQAKLQNFKNIVFHENNIESSIAMFSVRGQTVFGVHGDKDNLSNMVEKLTMYTTIKPNLIFCGHRHTNAMITSYDTKILQAGCFSGGGDEYCLDKRLRNKAEQIIAVVNSDGLDCFYDVKFKK